MNAVDVRVADDNDTKFSNVTEKQLDEEFVSIPAATKLLGVKYEQYTRRLLSEGKLEGLKVQRKGYTKWYISKSSVEAYNMAIRRSDGNRRFVLRAALDAEEEIRTALDTLNIEYDLELAFQRKSK